MGHVQEQTVSLPKGIWSMAHISHQIPMIITMMSSHEGTTFFFPAQLMPQHPTRLQGFAPGVGKSRMKAVSCMTQLTKNRDFNRFKTSKN